MGLTLSHSRADVARAILEGINIELARILEAVEELVPVRRLIASGGATGSGLVLQMLADLTGLPVAVAPHTETGLVGAGLLAWVGIGRWPDAGRAQAALPPPSRTVRPDPGRAAGHRALYDRYQKALAGLQEGGALSLGGEGIGD